MLFYIILTELLALLEENYQNYYRKLNVKFKHHMESYYDHTFNSMAIDEYFNYITRPLNELPLVFFISEDKKDFHSVIINNDGGGFAELSTIIKI